VQTRLALLRIVAFSLLIYSLWLFGSSLNRLSEAEAQLESCRAQLEAQRDERQRLEEACRAFESGEGIEELARERLGLVMPGERIFYFTIDGAVPEK